MITGVLSVFSVDGGYGDGEPVVNFLMLTKLPRDGAPNIKAEKILSRN